jgi:hypothetical protein
MTAEQMSAVTLKRSVRIKKVDKRISSSSLRTSYALGFAP